MRLPFCPLMHSVALGQFPTKNLFKSIDPLVNGDSKSFGSVFSRKPRKKNEFVQKPFTCNGIFLLHGEDKLADILCILGFRAFNPPIVLLPVSQRL